MNNNYQADNFYDNISIPKGKKKKSNIVYDPNLNNNSNQNIMKKYFLKCLIFPAVLISLIIILALLCLNPSISEFLTKNVSKHLAYIMSCMGNLSSFPIFDILFLSLVCVMIVFLIIAISLYCVKRPHTASFILFVLLDIILCFILLFQTTAGTLYNRTSIQDGMDIAYATTDSITKDEVYKATDYYIDQINAVNNQIIRTNTGKMHTTITFNTMTDNLAIMLNTLNKNDYLFNSYYRPKQLVTSNIASAFGIAGITMPLTGEIGINTNTFDYKLPMTIAHELAHSKGVMQENQATALALNVCVSGGADFKYSAYSNIVQNLLYTIYALDGKDAYNAYYAKVDPTITNEWAMYNEYIKQYDGFLSDVSDFFNNVYLKLNGVSNGIQSYSELDGYIIGLYRKQLQ